jgi:hypothetical protein
MTRLRPLPAPLDGLRAKAFKEGVRPPTTDVAQTNSRTATLDRLRQHAADLGVGRPTRTKEKQQ